MRAYRLAVFSLLIAIAALLPISAFADSYLDYLAVKAGARLNTLGGTMTAKREREVIRFAWGMYRLQQQTASLPSVGQAAVDGSYPTAHRRPGDVVTLTFFYVTTDTFSTAPTAGPAVTSVEYQVNTDPNNPNTFTSIGTSSDAGSRFSFAYTVGANEPVIQAIPKDNLGQPIMLTGVGGQNVARGLATVLQVDSSIAPGLGPVALTALMLVLGTLGVIALRRREQEARG